MLEVLSLFLFVLVVLLIAYVLYLRRERSLSMREIEVRAEEKFLKMKNELKKEILQHSRASLKGKIGEQIIPFLEQFRFEPSDARFIGSPIDYIIFDGYTEVKDRNSKQPITVVLADVKVGKSQKLKTLQMKIKEAVEKKRVKWETIHLQL